MKLQAGNYMRSDDAVYVCIDDVTIYFKGKIVLGVAMAGVFYRLDIEKHEKRGIYYRWIAASHRHSKTKKVIVHDMPEINRLCRASLVALAARYIDAQLEDAFKEGDQA